MRVSNSQVGCFKACRRMYQLKYIYGVEPVEKPEALSRGLSYHAAIERMLKFEKADDLNLDPKIKAMVRRMHFHFRFDIGVKEVEKWFEYKTPSGHTVIGRVDAIAENGRVIEHKTTSTAIDGAYFQRLEMDEQIPTYMIGNSTNEIIYTVCQTPTIRQKKNETDDEFENRCYDWYDDASQDGKKLAIEVLKRSPEQLELFGAEQDAIITEMENCSLFYRNPANCMKWGRMCEYAPICMHYDPAMEYIEFKKREDKREGNED